MKILYPNKIDVIQSYSSQQSSFPATNIISEHSKTETWKPESSDPAPYVTFSIEAYSNEIMVYNIGGEPASIQVVIKDSVGATVKDETTTLAQTSSWDSYNIPHIWVSYDLQTTGHTGEIYITKNSEVPYIGQVFAGYSKASWTDPKYGFGYNPKDWGIQYDLDNGYRYLYDRNTQRIYSVNFETISEAEYYALLRLADTINIQPFACLMSEHTTNYQENWILYGNFPEGGAPKGTLPQYSTYNINYTLSEVL